MSAPLFTPERITSDITTNIAKVHTESTATVTRRVVTLAVVTLQTFYLGKHDLLTVYRGKLDFLSVTDFSLGNLPQGNFIVWVLDMSRKQ